MIECCSENIWYTKKNKKNKKRKRKKYVALFIMIIIFFSCFFYYKNVTSKLIIDICLDSAYSYSADSINKGVMLSLSDSINYNDLINIEKNVNGDVAVMSANSYKINYVTHNIVKNIKLILDDKLNNGIDIPSFAFLGLPILSGYGKPIKFNSFNISSVLCNFTSRFESVGINQTLHIICADILVEVVVEMPFVEDVQNCSTSVIVCQTVIVGKVPEIYLKGGLFQ